MAIEIERRFLIKNDNWKEFINKKIYIEQGYLSTSLDGWIIRVRLIGKNSKIALKKHINISKALPTLNLNTTFHEVMLKQ